LQLIVNSVFLGSAESGSGRKETAVAVMNEESDSADEIAQGFGKGERLAHQTGTQSGIEAFQMIGRAALPFLPGRWRLEGSTAR
jgi:hypothetical protein